MVDDQATFRQLCHHSGWSVDLLNQNSQIGGCKILTKIHCFGRNDSLRSWDIGFERLEFLKTQDWPIYLWSYLSECWDELGVFQCQTKMFLFFVIAKVFQHHNEQLEIAICFSTSFRIFLFFQIYSNLFRIKNFILNFELQHLVIHDVLQLILKMNWEVVECVELPSLPTKPKVGHNIHICFNFTKENYHIKKEVVLLHSLLLAQVPLVFYI